MGIADMFVHASSVLEPQLRPMRPEPGLRFLTIGTMDFWVTWKELAKLGIRTITREDIQQHEKSSSDEFFVSSKKMCGKFFKHFGYDHYEELDINDRADVVWDLNSPVPKDRYEQYDFLLNVSGQYAMNAIQSYLNTMRMVKVGGKLMVHTHLGDMTNRFYLNPSPDFLIEFHTANGFVLEKAILQNRTGFSIPYASVNTKVSFVSTIIPFRYFWLYYFQQFFRDLPLRRHVAQKRVKKKIRTHPEQDKRKKLKENLIRIFGEKGFEHVKQFILSSQKKQNNMAMALSPDWVVWCVFRKVEKVPDDPRFQIPVIYRNENVLDQEKKAEMTGVVR